MSEYFIKKHSDYQIEIQADGYKRYQYQVFLNRDLMLHRVRLEPEITQLKEVIIKSDNRISIRGDTTFIDTDGIPIMPHADASELVSQIPGIRVYGDGTLSVMGKKINRVTVNGKLLFGGNATATLKALQGEMIKQLEVLAEAGSLNIRLKKEYENGLYGNVGASPATKSRYQVGTRFNRIHPTHFFNTYLSVNNINERVLTQQDEDSYNRSTFLEMRNGAYSITSQSETMPILRVQRTNVATNPNLLADPGEGITRMAGLGLNFSKSGARSSWTGFIFADQDDRNVERTEQQLISVGLTEQVLRGRKNTRQFTDWLRGNVLGTIQFSEKSSLRFSQTIAYKRLKNLDTNYTSLQLIDRQRNDTLLKNIFQTFQDRRQSEFVLSQHLAWLRRHAKKAHVTSAYLHYFYQQNATDLTYQNRQTAFVESTTINHNQIHQVSSVQVLKAELVHALPLSRRWLLESTTTANSSTAPFHQQAYQLGETTSRLVRPDLGFDTWEIQNFEWKSQLTALYKGLRWDLVAGMATWHWYSTRKLVSLDQEKQFFKEQQWMPHLFLMYRFSRQTKASFRYQISRMDPMLPDMLPVMDSSSIQVIRKGNPSLLNYAQRNAEVNVSTVVATANNLTFNLYYEGVEPPVNPQLNVGFLGSLNQTMRQYGHLNHWTFTFMWLNFNRSSPVQLYFFNFLSRRENRVSLSGENRLYQTLLNSTTLGIKGIGSQRVTFQFDYRFNLVKQLKAQTGVNIRNEGSVKANLNLKNQWYAHITGTAIVSKKTNDTYVANTIADLKIAKYLGEKSQIRLTLGATNIFDNRTIFEFQQMANTRSEESVNRLPRYFSFDFTYYWNKWKKPVPNE
ncbi:hypothetical protein BWI96_19305 [Siphonobacter sp. SORGH_AS_0500]|uniref:hypothetical protein n=1 Tax=Siphonobacter sp. SORGH_AS_0500 TaxID=1864824 RepID=UPI000CB69776|nr:hypothetical protein [Siphonobacter sp. SORGH_AS_0500]PKK34979.1 hypothetical protein BWI96_19305 [Siphonobacter sp. SORGH_AS_0500]